jgi:hypothetical protein
MGIVTAIAALAVLALVDSVGLATVISAIVAGGLAFAVTLYQERRKRR